MGILRRHWESARGHSGTSWLRLAALCGAAGVEREQPSSQRSLANRVSGIRGLKSMHEAFACCRVAGTQRRTAFLDHRNCSRCKRGPGGGNAIKGTAVTGLGRCRECRGRSSKRCVLSLAKRLGPSSSQQADAGRRDGPRGAELRQTVTRLRMAEAQPTNPDDKKHMLLKSGEVKWVLAMWSAR